MPVSAPLASPTFLWDLCFNVVLLAFWVHAWLRDPREAMFNPYLGTLNRLSGGVLHFLRPAFLMLPEKLVAIIALLLIAALRGFAAPSMAPEWTLVLGFEAYALHMPKPLTLLLFTVVSFAIFLFKVWGISLVYLRDDTSFRTSNTHGALHAASRPFIAIPYALRPFALLVFGMVITLGMHALLATAGAGSGHAFAAPVFWQCLISTIAGWVSILHVLSQTVFVLILLSLAGLLLDLPTLSAMSRDWTDMLIGPLRRFPLQIGMFDFTPVVFIFLMNGIHYLLMAFLRMQYMRLVDGVM